MIHLVESSAVTFYATGPHEEGETLHVHSFTATVQRACKELTTQARWSGLYRRLGYALHLYLT
jgi:hypothetical protein